MTAQTRVALTAPLIEAFAGTFLSPIYDNPAPTPAFHRKAWALYAQAAVRFASVVAPRSHAKSTALTHTFALATVCFRVQDYVVIASATEELAINHLGDIARELRENDDLRAHFLIESLVVDAKTDVIVRFSDGHRARLVAKGSGQKMRGMKWEGKRPGLILCDDLEEDEQVESRDRRSKFRRWFFRALLPCMRKNGIVRVHGTILHEDSLLARLQKSPTWQSLFFRAHRAFDDFGDILWPEYFTEAMLREIRQMFMDDGDAAGYSQEYLNDPQDNSDAFLRKDDFWPMKDEDYDSAKVFKAGVDFAVSRADSANRTSFTVGGKDMRSLIHVVDQLVGRWTSAQWTEILFELDSKWGIDEFVVEGGVIWKTIEPIIREEMRERDHYLNIRVINPVKDKAVRGQSYRKRHRSGGMRFDKRAEWYDAYEAENLRFTGTSDALQDDQFDSTALMVRGFDASAPVDEETFFTEDDYSFRRNDPRKAIGRSRVTGY